MNTKIITSVLLSLFLVLGIASAASCSLSTSTINFYNSQNSTSFTLTPTNTSVKTNYSLTAPSMQYDDSSVIPFNLVSSLSSVNTTQTINFATLADFSKLSVGKTYSGTLLVSNAQNSSDSNTINVNLYKQYCSSGDLGTNLSISNVDINNVDGDDTDWMPLDNIELEIEVANNNPDNGAKIDTEVKVALYDSNGKEYLDLDKVAFGKINKADSTTKTIKFQVPANVGKDYSTLYLYIKAYQKGKESQICASKFDSNYRQAITISREDEDNKLVVPYDVTFEPTTALCSDTVTVNAKIANVGDSDYDHVKVKITNADLGLNQHKVINSLNIGDKDEVAFSFNIPSTAAEKTYSINFRTYYDYNSGSEESDGSYGQASREFNYHLVVSGNCIKPSNISMTLNTAVQTTSIKEGKEVTIKTSIKNTGTNTESVVVSVSGNEDFSSVKSITPSTLSLAAGQSADSTIVIKLNSDSEGEKYFNVKVLAGTKEFTQRVSLSIEANSNIFSRLGANIASNWVIWLVVIVNIVLIVAIVLVVLRMMRN